MRTTHETTQKSTSCSEFLLKYRLTVPISHAQIKHISTMGVFCLGCLFIFNGQAATIALSLTLGLEVLASNVYALMNDNQKWYQVEIYGRLIVIGCSFAKLDAVFFPISKHCINQCIYHVNQLSTFQCLRGWLSPPLLASTAKSLCWRLGCLSGSRRHFGGNRCINAKSLVKRW